jgi:predicted O-linked N-acetylglucosamine transferase (SPINDLY family)
MRAVEIARDNACLNALRQRVTAAHHQSPLFDMVRYTKDVERAYVHMMEVAEQGGQPAHFRVSDLSSG